MKRFFTLTACLFFVIILIRPMITSFFLYKKAFAQTGAIGITGEVPKTIGIPADMVAEPCKHLIIPIEIDDATGIAGMELDLRFNPEILIPSDVERTSLTEDFLLMFRDSGDGLLRISLIHHMGITSGSGAFISLIFDVLSNAVMYGSTEISIEKIMLYNENADPIEGIVYENAQILIKGIKMNIPKGWSMISLPVIPDNASASALFADAVVIYKYKKDSGYIRVTKNEALEKGRGYWILFNKEKGYTFTGQPIQHYDLSLNEDGWDMIGGCTCPAQTLLHNGKIILIYQYVQGAGYQKISASDPLEPGNGYWMLTQDITEDAKLEVIIH